MSGEEDRGIQRDRFAHQERDLVLAPNEFAFILDETKGHVITYVGPTKTSLANTDKPVIFDELTKRFNRVELHEAIQTFVIAPEGWYVILKNPSSSETDTHPKSSTSNHSGELHVGHKVNIPGPISFPKWPGQMAQVVQGHHLRSNQYLMVQVYDEESAKAHWDQGVIKGKEGEEQEVVKPQSLRMGELMIIKGTEVSFYMPPTGVKVVKEGNDFVRDAVSLERLEFCILLDEDGNKRYVYGPDVVFPKPTETFVEIDGRKKLLSIELNPNMGIHVKVIAEYVEGKGPEEKRKKYKIGEELFITGKDTKIYYPRPEHASIKYGDDDDGRHYAVAIPKGEARYVLNKDTGEIDLVKGPKMYLPDPRTHVIVRRILDQKTVELWFPGNKEAQEYNANLLAMRPKTGGDEMFITEREFKSKKMRAMASAAVSDKVEMGDELKRRVTYTPPRTVTIETKYEGAVSICPWTGYAVLITSKTGKREVLVGPDAYLLEYDEILEAMDLSTDTPKTDDHLIKTAYLRVLHNKVSDKVSAETMDLVNVDVLLSYRVNFEGAKEKWFNVENYVKFLTDHMRSMIRNTIKKVGIEEFYANSIDILRDAILGAQEDGKRPGRRFEENGMSIYDAEILDVRIDDEEIESMLIDVQQSIVSSTLELTKERRRLEVTTEKEDIKRSIQDEQQLTFIHTADIDLAQIASKLEVELKDIESQFTAEVRSIEIDKAKQDRKDVAHRSELKRKDAETQQRIEEGKQKLAMILEEKLAEVKAIVEKAKAVSPQMISALQAFGDKDVMGKLAQSMAPMSILGGKSVAEIMKNMLGGLPIADILANLGAKQPAAKKKSE